MALPDEELIPAAQAEQREHEDEMRAERRTSIGAQVVYEAVKKEGEYELERTSSALAWSGIAAGLSMGLGLLAEGMLREHLPAAEWRPLVTKLGYAVGFIVVILGRQQLFTENTLTPIIPLLDKESHVRLHDVLRLWGVVLAANLIGVAAFAWAATIAFEPATRTVFHEIGVEAYGGGGMHLFVKGIYAGWLVALIVWLQPAAESARIWVILILAYLIGIAELPHIIAGSVEVLHLVFGARLSFGEYLGGYMLPTLLGNIFGGLLLVAALNYAQVVSGRHDR